MTHQIDICDLQYEYNLIFIFMAFHAYNNTLHSLDMLYLYVSHEKQQR